MRKANAFQGVCMKKSFLVLVLLLSFGDHLNDLRARRELSPQDMRRWLEFRETLPLAPYPGSNVA